MTLNSIWCAKSKTLTCLSLSERTYVPSGPLLYYTSHPNYASVDDSATRPFQMAMIRGLEDWRIVGLEERVMMDSSEALRNCSLIRCLHPSYSYIGSEDIDV